jgi:hypothetical protein
VCHTPSRRFTAWSRTGVPSGVIGVTSPLDGVRAGPGAKDVA